jgi:hypothetical protein
MERQTTPPDPPDDPFAEFVREYGSPGSPPPGPEGPPPGWQDGPPPPPPPGLDPRALFVLLDSLRRVVPRELESQFTNLIREFLLTLRSLIDWYLERLDRPAREPRVEDIPID